MHGLAVIAPNINVDCCPVPLCANKRLLLVPTPRKWLMQLLSLAPMSYKPMSMPLLSCGTLCANIRQMRLTATGTAASGAAVPYP